MLPISNMTLETVLKRVYSLANERHTDEPANIFNRDNVKRELAAAIQAVYNIVSTTYEIRRGDIVSQTDGVEIGGLSVISGFPKVDYVKFDGIEVPKGDLRKIEGEWQTGTPQFYDIEGDTLFFHPSPATGTFEIKFLPQMPELDLSEPYGTMDSPVVGLTDHQLDAAIFRTVATLKFMDGDFEAGQNWMDMSSRVISESMAAHTGVFMVTEYGKTDRYR